MEDWQFHELIESDTETGQKRPLGGAISSLHVATAEGQLNELEITPADVEMLKEALWNGGVVCLKLADRRVWLDQREVQTVIALFQTALNAARQNKIKAKLS